jgi:hypothetical protein
LLCWVEGVLLPIPDPHLLNILLSQAVEQVVGTKVAVEQVVVF